MRLIGRLILSAVILLLAAGLATAAYYLPNMVFPFYTEFSRNASEFLSGITGPFPFPLWQVLLVGLALLLVYGLVRTFVKRRGLLAWAGGVVVMASVLIFFFVGLWGVNHFAPSVAQRVGLSVEEYSVAQLRDTTRYMAEKANQWADKVSRDENGDMVVDFDAFAKKAHDGYDALEESNDFFDLSDEQQVKALLVPEAFSYMGLTGIYIAYTGESCVNPNTYNASVPFTMCHELAHSLTVAPEDEANFCAFLACINNDDPAFQYSAWYSAYVYTYNALVKVDAISASEIRGTLSETVRRDVQRASEHYDRYEGEVQDMAEKANDLYLRAFQEESGVRSYGEVADLLIAWYLQR